MWDLEESVTADFLSHATKLEKIICKPHISTRCTYHDSQVTVPLKAEQERMSSTLQGIRETTIRKPNQSQTPA